MRGSVQSILLQVRDYAMFQISLIFNADNVIASDKKEAMVSVKSWMLAVRVDLRTKSLVSLIRGRCQDTPFQKRTS